MFSAFRHFGCFSSSFHCLQKYKKTSTFQVGTLFITQTFQSPSSILKGISLEKTGKTHSAEKDFKRALQKARLRLRASKKLKNELPVSINFETKNC